MWTVEYEQDIASDLSVFHRVDDPLTLDGPIYFERAQRLGAYAGVMQARIAQEHERERGPVSAPSSSAHPTQSSAPSGATRVSDDVALAMLAADDWAPERVTEGSTA